MDKEHQKKLMWMLHDKIKDIKPGVEFCLLVDQIVKGYKVGKLLQCTKCREIYAR